jgi:hypothetical protein
VKERSLITQLFILDAADNPLFTDDEDGDRLLSVVQRNNFLDYYELAIPTTLNVMITFLVRSPFVFLSGNTKMGETFAGFRILNHCPSVLCNKFCQGD